MQEEREDMMTKECPCGSGAPYAECCHPFHSGAAYAADPEKLMRSRYSAYVVGEIEYLAQTIPLAARRDFDKKGAKEWSESAEWLGLEVLSSAVSDGGRKGRVEFIARFKQQGIEHTHHEVSRFSCVSDRWYYLDGKVRPSVPSGLSVSRNAPCPCGSGRKYKRCCAG